MLLRSGVIKIKGHKEGYQSSRKKIFKINQCKCTRRSVFSSFFAALTLLKEKSYIKIKNVGLNSTRLGFYNLLKTWSKNKIFKNSKQNNEIRGYSC